ncbi:chemotaxis-specific protein-glutamate methyltransferase CheB [Thalassolituus maritimus]|uniref:Protein-glutamate methylesterase/protein-glutamine glutaminase n=1 Tax=Thalassolituus maritimus TaxID=484498 RepID=A0ABQ0A0P0_9GAMM|nr:chemotaxis-specific protein-glutamate methyltransferase CheB [Pseudomonadota bacterium]
MLKLLIVDDSALMRRHLTQLFESEGDFTICHARNGNEAVAMNREFKPDVVTLDINMPEMDGISALSLIMAERPVPVIMLSSLTQKGALATFEALNLGAVDFVAKPGGTISMSLDDVAADLIRKVRTVTKAKIRPSSTSSKSALAKSPAPARPTPRAPQSQSSAGKATGVKDKVVLIGVSTGGPRTLEDILPALPANLNAPIVIAQHMPASFTKSLASRLDRACPMRVEEVDKATALESGTIYIGRGNADITLTVRKSQLHAISKPEDKEYLWHPSVELLGKSALRCCDPKKVLAILLTGMGHDGSRAFTELHNHGASTIAESSETAIVFGMPAELIERRGAGKVLPAQAIANEIINFVGK